MRKFCDGGIGWGGRALLSLGTAGGGTSCRDMASHVSAVRCTIEADGDVRVVETLVVKTSWVEGT